MRRDGYVSAAKKKGPWRSGFCGHDLPPESHARCHGVYIDRPCVCDCHQEKPVFKPGLVYDMSDETYHADPVPGGSLSSTFARLLTNHVPAKADAIRRNRKPTKSMNLGKAAHATALGAGPDLIVWEHDGRTKEGKAERASRAFDLESERSVAVTSDERDRIVGMAEVLRAELELRDILDNCASEVSGFWQEGEFDETRCQGCLCVSEHDGDYGSSGHAGSCPPHTCRVWCRARYDLLGALGWDYKTAEDCSTQGFEHAMSTYGYHQQAEFYQRGLRALGHQAAADPMRFIVQETQEPYLIQIHTCDPLSIEVAAALNDRAIDIYARAKASGEWEGYPDLHAEPTGLPNRYFYRHADVIPDHLNPFAEPEMNM